MLTLREKLGGHASPTAVLSENQGEGPGKGNPLTLTVSPADWQRVSLQHPALGAGGVSGKEPTGPMASQNLAQSAVVTLEALLTPRPGLAPVLKLKVL